MSRSRHLMVHVDGANSLANPLVNREAFETTGIRPEQAG
jgi:hypothetical protein